MEAYYTNENILYEKNHKLANLSAHTFPSRKI